MNRIFRKATLLFIMLFSLTAGFSQSFDVTPALPMDTNFKIGKLENGLTYYIRAAKNPEGRAEFFIVHNVGSLQENDSQRGLAHFLEHMAFNGTKNFPKKQLLEYFGGIGVRFGYNINAYTAMDRTVYNISAVPVKLRSTIIDSALLALHDWSHYISCEQEEIDKERGVVHEEWRRGDDARTRMLKGINKRIQTGSRFAQRDVIGLMEVVDNFSRETLIDYYHKWYRPDLQAVIVVGDIDIKDIEKRIKEIFSTIPKIDNGATREIYTIPENTKPIVGFNTDPESKAVSVRLVVKIPKRTIQEKESYLACFDDITETMIKDMINGRIQVMLEEPDAACKAVIPVFGNVVYDGSTFTATALPSNHKNPLAALKEVVTEVERIKQYGFEPQEIQSSKQRVQQKIEKAYKRSEEPKNSDYVSAAVEHFTRNSPLLDIDAYNKLSKEILGKITNADINLAIKRVFSDNNRVIIFSVPDSDKEYLPTEDQVLAMLDNVKSTELDKFVPITDKEIEKPVIETPGKIISSKIVTSDDYKINYEKQLDSATEWVLENGAKVIWKESYANNKKIKFQAFHKGGMALPIDPKDIKLIQSFLKFYSVNGLNRNDLTKWNSKNRVSIYPDINYRYHEFSGSFNEKGSDNFFSLLHLYFTDVSAQERDVDNMKSRLLKNFENQKGESNKFNDSVSTLQYVSNPMNVEFGKEYIKNISAKKLEDLYNIYFTDPTGFTFVFSGPMSAQEGKKYVEKYIASIKSKEFNNPKLVYKEPKLSKGTISLRYFAPNMLSSKATVTRIYSGKAKYSPENQLMAKYITYIMRDRYMKSIREDKGGTYYVGVKSDITKHPESLLSFTIDFDTDPALVDELLEIVQLEIDEFVKSGPTEKEMKEISLYLKKVSKDNKKETEWTSIIANAIKDENTLAHKEKNLLNSMDAKKIHKLAKSIFKTGNKMTFVFEPKQ